MTELQPCPFPMAPQPVIEKVGNCYEIRCIENKRGIHISVTVRVREDVGDMKTIAKIWNTRHYPPEVMQAVERMKAKKVIRRETYGKKGNGEEYLLFTEYACPSCGIEISILDRGTKFCANGCGQALDWSEEIEYCY